MPLTKRETIYQTLSLETARFLTDEFCPWLDLDLATRSAKRAQRQKKSLCGIFVQWGFAKVPNSRQLSMRTTDATFRLALMVETYCRTGLTIEQACDQASGSLLARRLGHSRRGRPSPWRESEKGPIDDTIRSIYKSVHRKRANLKEVLDSWITLYLCWRSWVLSADYAAIDFVLKSYKERGEEARGRVFLRQVGRIRKAGEGRIDQIKRELFAIATEQYPGKLIDLGANAVAPSGSASPAGEL